jgi:hypothetical protein
MKSFDRLAAACLVTVAACSSAPGQGDAEQPTSQATSALVIGLPPRPTSPCLSVAPAAGTACSDPSLVCSWGDDARFGCRTVEACDSGAWKSVGLSCTKAAPVCPAASPGLDGGLASCTSADLGLTCVYDHEAFTCAPCTGNVCFGENRWLSAALPNACPATEPNYGEECSVAAGTECNFNVCANGGADNIGAAMTCTEGFWKATEGTICP